MIFILVLFWMIYCDSKSVNIISEAAENPSTKSYTIYLLSAFYVAKALLLSTILYILGWSLKNYRSEMHNYVINKHKAMSLTVATGILSKDEFKDVERAIVFKEGMNIVFSHQSSGYSKDDQQSPSVVNTLLNKSIPES